MHRNGCVVVFTANSLHECITSLPEMAIAMSCARLFSHAATELLRIAHKVSMQGGRAALLCRTVISDTVQLRIQNLYKGVVSA